MGNYSDNETSVQKRTLSPFTREDRAAIVGVGETLAGAGADECDGREGTVAEKVTSGSIPTKQVRIWF